MIDVFILKNPHGKKKAPVSTSSWKKKKFPPHKYVVSIERG